MKETRAVQRRARAVGRTRRPHAHEVATMADNVRRAVVELGFPEPVIVAGIADAAQCPAAMVFLRREVSQLHADGVLDRAALRALCSVKVHFPSARLEADDDGP